MKDPKSLAMLVLGRKPEGESDDDEKEEGDDGLQMAAEEALAAVKAGDAKAFGEALKAFVGMCGHEEE